MPKIKRKRKIIIFLSTVETRTEMLGEKGQVIIPTPVREWF